MVFISYTNRDRKIADNVRVMLNNSEIECWMAPYSIEGGTDYACAIPDGIMECSVFVLILSQAANDSVWVPKELDIALSSRKQIVPFRVNMITNKDKFMFRLADIQIIEYDQANKNTSYSNLYTTIMRKMSESNQRQTDHQIIDTTSTSPIDMYVCGIQHYLAKEYDKAFECLNKSAEAGYGLAQYKLATCYENGIGVVKKDFAEAMKWYRLSAGQSNNDALRRLGQYYLNANTDNQNSNEVFQCFSKAALADDIESQCLLGNCYYLGIGCERDIESAIKWYKLAAGNYSSEALWRLGVCYSVGIGVERDLKQSLNYFKTAADLHHPLANYELGRYYFNGASDGKSVIKQNLEIAIDYYIVAANKGCTSAKFELAKHYLSEYRECKKKDINKAKELLDQATTWLTEASSKGHVQASMLLLQSIII